ACTDDSLTPGSTYQFRVLASNDVGDSAFSLPSTPEMAASEPAAPVAPIVVRGDVGELDISWAAPTDNGSGILEYSVVQVSPAGGEVCNLDGAPPVTECTVAGLSSGTQYTFAVSARNVPGWGPNSDASTPLAPTG